MNKTIKISYSPTFLILTLILVILKLTGVLDIGWIWVFGLLWMPIAIFTAFILLILIIGTLLILGEAIFGE